MKRKLSHKVLAVLLTLCLLMVSVPALSAGAEVDLENGLLAYWDFDDVTGSTVENKAPNGDAAYNGSLQGAATVVDNGTFDGGMLSLSGTSGNHMLVTDAINTQADSFSFSLWINFNENISDSVNYDILQQSGSGRTILLYRTTDALGTFISGANADTNQTYDLTGSWHHIVMTSDASTRNVRIYVDGEMGMDTSLTSDYNGVTNLLIGCHKDNSGAVYGDMDEIRYYNRAINEEEVKALFDLGAPYIRLQLLNSTIAEAKALIATKALDDDAAESVALQEAIDAAQALADDPADVSDDELAEAIEALEKAMDAYIEASENLPITITVDPDNIINTTSGAFYGANHRYYDNALGSYDPETGTILEQFDGYMKDASFGSIRYPGGTVGNLVHWKDIIGDLEDRTTQPHGFFFWNNNVVPNFGLDEAASYIIDELGAEMIYMYGIGRGSAQDAADLVEYLNAEVGEDPNGDGVDWAAVRAANGHPEPYGVTKFEIGNEPNSDWYQTYWLNGRASGRSLIDAYVYGSAGSDGLYSKENAFTFAVDRTEDVFAATYVADADNWNNSTRLSSGEAGQVKYIKYAPIVPGSETVTVGGTVWTRVETLEGAGAENVYTIDNKTGEIRFGDGVNGNIPAKNAEIRAGYTKLADGLVDYYEAMKAVDPDIEIYASIHANAFIDLMYNNDEDRWDGLVYHPYTHQGSLFGDGDAQFYEKIMERGETVIDTNLGATTAYLESKGFGDKQMAISEYGIYNSSSYLLGTQTNALYNAKALFTMSKMPSIAYTNRHCVNDFIAGDTLGPGLQAIIQSYKNSDGSYSFVSTPSARMFEMFGNMTGHTVIGDSISRNVNFYNNVSAISTLSTKDDDGNIYLAIINLDKTNDHEVVYKVNGVDFTDKTVEIWTLAGDEFDSANTLDDPDAVDIEITEFTSNAKNLRYTVPAHSIVMIKVEGAAEPDYKFGDVTNDGAITSLDATVVLQYAAGIVEADDDRYEYRAADVSGDGAVTSLDATYILQYAAGLLENGFPVEQKQ